MSLNVAVIGAGVIGSSIAASLAAKGANVTVLTDRWPGAGTSQASFAWINALQKFPIEYLNMNVNGMRYHAEYAAKHGSAPWYHPGGNVECGTEDAQAEIFDKMREFGYNAKWLTHDELQALEPDLNVATLRGAQIAYYPDEGWIDLVSLIAQLLVDVRQAGGSIVSGAVVTGFEMQGDRITAAKLANGEKITADVFINAAGPNAENVAKLAGCHLPMSNTPGVQVFTAPIAATVGRVVHLPGLSIRPDGGGRLCLHNHGVDRELKKRASGEGQTEMHPETGYSFELAAAQPLADRLGEVYPVAKGVPIEASRIAMRPIPADRKPVIGFMPSATNFYASVMHSGASQCLWVGELVSRELVTNREAPELATFRPARFVE